MWFQSSTHSMASGNTQWGVHTTNERSPLLDPQLPPDDDLDGAPSAPEGKITTIIWTVLAGVFAVGLILMFTLPVPDWGDPFPTPESILKSAPVIDGHIGQFNPPHAFHPQNLGSSRINLRNKIYPNWFGSTMRTTYLRSILTSRCSVTLTYQG